MSSISTTPVVLVPGNWVARGAEGTPLACCPRIAQVNEQLEQSGINRHEVTFEKVAAPDDEFVELGGIEAGIG